MKNPLDFLDHLREGSESQRRRFAVITAFSITGIVFVAWMMSFSAGKNVYTKTPTASSTSPLAAIGDAVQQGTDIIKNFKEIIAKSQEQLSATSTETKSQ